jgi:hypothetical protein
MTPQQFSGLRYGMFIHKPEHDFCPVLRFACDRPPSL